MFVMLEKSFELVFFLKKSKNLKKKLKYVYMRIGLLSLMGI